MKRSYSYLCLAASLLLFSATAAAQQRTGLWTSAGRRLEVVRHDVVVTIQHPVVETVVTQEFQNPHPFNVETTFFYPVPPGATVTGMALWVPGIGRREARMLERQKAREIYQGIVNEKRDPALLERMDGNIFRIRIFPVLARTRQRVELRFVQPVAVTGPGSYRLTLRRPPGKTLHSLRLGLSLRAPFELGQAHLRGHDGRALRRLDAHRFVLPLGATRRSLARDIHLDYGAARKHRNPAVASVVHGGRRLFVADLAAPGGGKGRGPMAVLVDRSSSMRTHHKTALAAFRALLSAGAGRRLDAVGFGLLPHRPLRLELLNRGRRQQLLQQLEQGTESGGTAFAPAVKQAMAAGARHIVLITDGATKYHIAELEHLLRLLFDSPSVALSVVAMSGSLNASQLKELASVSGGQFHQLTSEVSWASLGSQLQGVRPRQAVSCASGKAHVIERRGGSVLVVGSVPEDSAASLELQLAGQSAPQKLPWPAGEAARVNGVRGLWASAAMGQTMRQIKLFGENDTLRSRVVAISRAHNVLSEYTALLATETDQDYLRPTSGRKWQRKAPAVSTDLPPPGGFGSTPEPHEWALMAIMLAMLLWARGKGWRRGQWGRRTL